MVKRIYFDHSASTPLAPEVLEAMLTFYREKYGNASSIHSFGREARVAIEEAREQIAKVIRAKAAEIIFTSGGTEADNLAIKGVAFAHRGRGNHIVTSKVEHPAVLNTCAYLQKHHGFEVTYLPVDRYGMVEPDDVRRAMTDHTILVSIMHVNNEVGSINSIEDIGKIARERGVLFHTDAVQSFGKIPINVQTANIDLLSVSAHKIYGPKGVGALYVRKGVMIEKLFHGGDHERNLRAGTENVPGIVGLGKAAALCLEKMAWERDRLMTLRDALREKLFAALPNLTLNGHPTQRVPGNLHLSVHGIEGESLIMSLDLKGIAASSGSACASGKVEPSHVLLAMGIQPELAMASVRFTLGRGNTMEEVEYTVEAMKEIVERLRKKE